MQLMHPTTALVVCKAVATAALVGVTAGLVMLARDDRHASAFLAVLFTVVGLLLLVVWGSP